MHCCRGVASFVDCSQLLLHGEDHREWYWWERWFCGQTRRSIRENMRSMLWSNFVFAVIALAALIATLVTEKTLHEADAWSGVDVALSLPLLLLHLRWTWRGDTRALKRIIPWCLAITVAYALGSLADLLEVIDASKRKTVPRLVEMITDMLSCMMWANLLYFDFLFAYSPGALLGPQSPSESMLHAVSESSA